MDKHKSVGVDNVHAAMLKVAPEFFARILSKVWEKVGESLIVPTSWSTGITRRTSQLPALVYDVTHTFEVLEKAVTAELECVLKTDRMEYGFQSLINILQAAVKVAAKLDDRIGQVLEVLELAKTY